MSLFSNQGPVASQIGSQYVSGNVNNNFNYSSIASRPPNYDLGIRFGQAPEIDQHYFVGREHELERLQTWLEPTPSNRNIVVLHGMGGIGKTQLSIHFVRQTSTKYTAVFWLNAKNEKTLRAGLAALSIEIFESSTAVDADDEERLVQQARHWLSRPDNDQWLLLYDNYDDPKLPSISSSTAYDIRTYFPPRAHGSILITTRSQRLKFGRQLHLKKLENEGHSLSILAIRSGRSVDTDPAASELVRRLDGLPLALATAGTYLSRSADSFEHYLQLYVNSWNDLRDNDYELEDYEERTLYSTWNISYQQIQQQDPIAAQLLALMAYFDNQDLWYELFNAGSDLNDTPEWWYEVIKSRPRFQRAVTILQNYSLLEVHSSGYSLHPCVHDWTLEYLNRKINLKRYRIAIHSVAKSVSWEIEDKYWIQNRRVLPHARRLQHSRFQGITVIAPHDQVYVGYLYQKNDMYPEAEEMYKRALAGCEKAQKALGVEHISTFGTVNNLGLLYADQDKLAEAEEINEPARAGIKKALGAEHASTLTIFHNLGNLYADQGKLAEAEETYKRALAGYEKALGAEYILTLGTVNNLGILYAGQDKLAEAEEMYKRALVGYEKALGAEHTSTLTTVNNLASLYAGQGKLAEAEKMYKRALVGREKKLGAEHTSTLTIFHNLGNLYRDQDKLAEAEEMYKRALVGYEKALGAEHTSTLTIFHNLGNLYRDQGKLVEAEEMYKRALAGREKALGAEHTSTLTTNNSLGNLYRDQGKLAEAEEMYKRALAGREKALGVEHTSTLTTNNSLGNLYADQDKLAEAEEMYKRALAGREKALGAEHTSTLTTVNNLGVLYAGQGKLAEADEMYKRALVGREKALGAEHTSTLTTVSNLGSLYYNQGKLAEAEKTYERALAGCEKVLGAEHTLTLTIFHNLGNLYWDQGNLATAEQYLKRVATGRQKLLGTDHPSTKRVLESVQKLSLAIISNQDNSQEIP